MIAQLPFPSSTRPRSARCSDGPGLVVDLFAGGGGASTGIEAALGRPVDVAVNHSAVAIAVHEANHRGTRHLTTDVFEVDPVEATRGQPVELLWASPDCTHFSRAKGSRPDRPRSRKLRSLAWVVVRWARAVQPRVILMENVLEWLTWGPLDAKGQPVAARIGRTFREWRRQLERAGYDIEWKELEASRYGAPTRRKRLFIVARCDGEPIRWPAPTHGPGLQPFRTAGECIDWSVPTRSIFDRERPLAEKTLHRIAEGIRRFVIENPRPYIVRVNHGRDEHRGQKLDEPLTTVEASRRGHALVTPIIVEPGQRNPETGGRKGAGEPLGTVVAKDRHALAVPYLVNTRNGERDGQTPRVRDVADPAPTVTAKGSQGAIASAVLVGVGGPSYGGKPKDAAEPLATILKESHTAVASVALVDMQRENAPRSLDEPLGTITTQGNRFNELRAAFVARHFGGVIGDPPDVPLGTVTARDHHGPVAATLVKFRGECNGASLDEPAPVITSQGLHLAECRAFLVKYFGAAKHGQPLTEGLGTLTSKPRFGLVVVDGVEYEIADIYLRMLEPHELLRAQFGEFADGYDLGPARTKEAKTRLIGNSVCPHVAAALVRANVLVRQEAVVA